MSSSNSKAPPFPPVPFPISSTSVGGTTVNFALGENGSVVFGLSESRSFVDFVLDLGLGENGSLVDLGLGENGSLVDLGLGENDSLVDLGLGENGSLVDLGLGENGSLVDFGLKLGREVLGVDLFVLFASLINLFTKLVSARRCFLNHAIFRITYRQYLTDLIFFDLYKLYNLQVNDLH